MKYLKLSSVILACSLAVGAEAADPKPLAAQILETAGVKGGLVVHVGCGDGKLTAALRANDSFIVHGLDADVTVARKHIQSLGLYGPVSVAKWTGERLPYVDNLVNLVVAENLGKVSMDEVLRVLVPGGVALIGGKKTVKPWPKDIDEWTHYLHGPNNNAVAHDTVVGPPRHMQWLADPLFARDHNRLASISAMVSHGGRLFCIVDENAVPVVGLAPKWRLVARDAFNGGRLWERAIGTWADIERHFRSGPDQLPRLLVAAAGRVYAPLGFDQSVGAMDAVTGKTLKVYPETKGTEEIIIYEGVLLAVVGTPVPEQSLAGAAKSAGKKKNTGAEMPARPEKSIVAIRTDSGQLMWRKSSPDVKAFLSLTLAADGKRVFFADGSGVACVDLETGKLLWRHPSPEPTTGPIGHCSGTLVVRDGVALVVAKGEGKGQKRGGLMLTALSADNGKKLWEAPCGNGSFSPPDVFVIGGLVWTGKEFEAGRDLRAGEVKKPFDIASGLWTAGHHHRCYREKATDRFILTGYRGIELLDLAGDEHSRNNWVRGGCQYGILPCNGLIYAPTHVCGCYLEAMLHGFWALAPERKDAVPEAKVVDRLERGPAYDANHVSRVTSHDSDWPTYRGNAARSGSTSIELPPSLASAWQAQLGGRLSAPVVADGKVFVSSIDQHRVVALDATQGKVLWSFTAGGRVDTPPTIWQDCALFGCADGWVYCLSANDGQLRWRFLAAAYERSTVAMEQLESVWPVNGSVLVQDGLAYVAAGRSSYLDGGIRLYALEPRTGRVMHERTLRNDHSKFHNTPLTGDLAALQKDDKPDWPRTQNRFDLRTYLDPDKSDGFSMDGATTDVMVGDGTSVYLRQLRFDSNLVPQKHGAPHLYSTTRLIDDAAAHRTHWLLGTGDTRPLGVSYEWHTRRLTGANARVCSVPFGLMLAFDSQTAWGISKSSELYAVGLRPVSAATQIDFRPPQPENVLKQQWSVDLPVIARAMVRTGGTLWVAGLPDGLEKKQISGTRDSLSGPGVLASFSTTGGKACGDVRLAAPPVWDGMAVAHARLYLSLKDGSVLCLQRTDQ